MKLVRFLMKLNNETISIELKIGTVVQGTIIGSGKTLAFGLPILQCLLQEREKTGVPLTERGNDVEKGALGSTLRALIITPTRELALQVADHLKVASKLTNISVVPIVGGMSSELQERLLKARPEIIIGTPGRLWELMQGGDHHLVEAYVHISGRTARASLAHVLIWLPSQNCCQNSYIWVSSQSLGYYTGRRLSDLAGGNRI